jgi:1,4-alpha-glucan branching enzyme
MPAMQKTTLPKQELEALVQARHGDPFRALGLHRAEEGGFLVRAFLPGAHRALVLEQGREPVVMERVHPDGLFEARFDRPEAPRYRLRVEWDGRNVQEMEDPYAFGQVLTDFDLHLLKEGSHLRAYDKLGAHPWQARGVNGVLFAVWAPNATRVSVVGDFNQWDGRRHPMRNREGIWEIFIPGLQEGTLYKYEIRGRSGELHMKADPYGFSHEKPPKSASVVYDIHRYKWSDSEWMARRERVNALDAPISIYELQLGSWRRKLDKDQKEGAYLTYAELAEQLIPYVKGMGYTHIELLPIAEFPFDGSWGYQTVGYFAPTSRFGSPSDFKAFIDACHRADLGVIVDWVPAHFPTDAHGLANFDGSPLYEHADPRQGFHPDWQTAIFNYGRREVWNFLMSNALFWLKEYHVDGLRVDAVASMIYLDYSRKAGEWIPNRYGGNENLEAIEFLKQMNIAVHREFPGVLTIAEESTAWPAVSRPVYAGGLGFSLKWNMGWMHDTLEYISKDPIHRKYHHNNLTFGLLYAFHENFVLVLSHDEVVHGKRALLSKMPGDSWQKFANLRIYLAFQFAHPGKKLLFMGGEFGQWDEWNHAKSLDWHLAEYPPHRGVQQMVRDLNRFYSAEPSMHEVDFEPAGFEWIDANDGDTSVLSFIRYARKREDFAVCVFNFTPVVRYGYRVGVPEAGFYTERMNSDSELYGGSNVGNLGGVQSENISYHGRPHSLLLTLPPLGGVILKVKRS